MKNFDNCINAFLHKQIFKESIIDIPRDSLDQTVFQFFDDGRLPLFKDGIKKQIITDINKLDSIIPIVNFFAIGSILTKSYDEKSDLDVNVQVDAEMADVIATGEIMHVLKKLNGNLAVGTTHPINYYIVTQEYDLDKTEAAYDIANERWLKTPDEISPDIQQFVNKVRSTFEDIDITTGEIRRDLIDLAEIKRLKLKDVRKLHTLITKKMGEIDENIKQLVNVYQNLHTLRTMAFDRVMTPEEIRLYGHKNRLPENVIYKLLEKYYYIKFMKELKHILDEKEKIDNSNIDDVKKVSNKFYGNI
jgi:hypothetical protein